MNHFEKKTKIIEEVAKGGRVVIIDPENEYKELAKALGGTVITINPADGGVFNPFLVATEHA
jgi:type IV secretory pathway VirB4 component